MLTVIDEFTRECLAIKVARRIRHDNVLACLTELFTWHGPSDYIGLRATLSTAISLY